MMLDDILKSPTSAMAAGAAAIFALVFMAWLGGHIDMASIAGLVLRVVHVLAAMVWVGLIWFVNAVQLPALADANETDRSAILRKIVPGTAENFRFAANATVITGVLMLFAFGYLTQRAPQYALWIWLGTFGGLAMLAFVHAKISPALRILLDDGPGAVPAKAAARETVRFYARCNLLLAGPVTFAMVAAAHV
jgi:uncharacterized membrane protein